MEEVAEVQAVEAPGLLQNLKKRSFEAYEIYLDCFEGDTPYVSFKRGFKWGSRGML